jgi:hypothetical protein
MLCNVYDSIPASTLTLRSNISLVWLHQLVNTFERPLPHPSCEETVHMGDDVCTTP